ncbi:BMA_0021/BMA_0022 family TOMM bacteriocin [Haliangium sp.]|uniref:BMA_0021/BMA_0022 family TOMM bacteriocin n=1 Tax=Haliangium sp. TaxID=2663208 RepID=UPI003D141407
MPFDFPTWQAAWIKAIAKSWEDENFRKALFADPRSAIKAYFGFDLPGDFKVSVTEGAPTELLREMALIIPPRPAAQKDQAEVLAEYADRLLTDERFLCSC